MKSTIIYIQAQEMKGNLKKKVLALPNENSDLY